MNKGLMNNGLRTVSLTLACFAALFLLSACEGAKEQLGLTRQAPDEFAVVKRAPLAMPPDYTLRPPRPGAPRPQERAATQEARDIVFNGNQAESTSPEDIGSAEEYLLEKTGADEADPGIREIVDTETRERPAREKPVAERLLGWGSEEKPPADIVDAEAEAERLKKNREEGKPVTEGETPSLEE